MNTTNQTNLIQLLRRIPPKWAIVIVGVVLAYWLGQPILNRTFDWNLPTIASMLGEPDKHPRVAPIDEEATREAPPANTRDTASPTSSKIESNSNSKIAAVPKDDSVKPIPKIEAKSKLDSSKKTPISPPPKPATKPATKNSQYSDYLTEVGPDRYKSPAGLFYNRGSEEGHRLKHLARHLEDQPNRPGSHGVFNGDLTQALKWIDEAYQKATKGDRSARTRKEDESTIYEVTFEKSIGYIGGSDGKRRHNPPTKRIRIVVMGPNVITAFPF